MEIRYKSTRSESESVTASQAILMGLAKDGGLFVPTAFPKLSVGMEELSRMSYREVAFAVLRLFLSDYTDEELWHCINSAYDEKFDVPEIAPIRKVEGVYYLELFHGATIAFKDMALSILPHLLTTAAKKNANEGEIVILTATSGDTGKAALAGFADVKGTRIIVFYPKHGVSRIQEKQMVTQKGANTTVIGITGNFDDAQTGVKQMFGDEELKSRMRSAGFNFSSANSINIGRLVPQIVYYVYAYARLYADGVLGNDEKLNVTVPTGNFGNILAAYYAKQIGLPIGKLICASNENKVLFDFFQTGTYDKNRKFMLTSSPSMDILISSNLERLIYLMAGSDSAKTAEMMDSLKKTGSYSVTEEMLSRVKDFIGGFATEEQTEKMIHDLFRKTGYLIDPHTAVAACVSEQYRTINADSTVTLIASTASPFKFTRTVMGAVDRKYEEWSDFELVDELSCLTQIPVPKAIEEIRTAPILHFTVCETREMQSEVEKVLKL